MQLLLTWLLHSEPGKVRLWVRVFPTKKKEKKAKNNYKCWIHITNRYIKRTEIFDKWYTVALYTVAFQVNSERLAYPSVCCCCCCSVTSVVSNSVRPHRQQPTRLPHPWDSPGKNTGVGCHFPLQCMEVKSESQVARSSPILCDPMDCSPPGSCIHGILQARVLEWGAISLGPTNYLEEIFKLDF